MRFKLAPRVPERKGWTYGWMMKDEGLPIIRATQSLRMRITCSKIPFRLRLKTNRP